MLFKQLDDVLETDDDDDDNKTAELKHRYSMNALKSQHSLLLINRMWGEVRFMN